MIASPEILVFIKIASFARSSNVAFSMTSAVRFCRAAVRSRTRCSSSSWARSKSCSAFSRFAMLRRVESPRAMITAEKTRKPRSPEISGTALPFELMNRRKKPVPDSGSPNDDSDKGRTQATIPSRENHRQPCSVIGIVRTQEWAEEITEQQGADSGEDAENVAGHGGRRRGKKEVARIWVRSLSR